MSLETLEQDIADYAKIIDQKPDLVVGRHFIFDALRAVERGLVSCYFLDHKSPDAWQLVFLIGVRR